MRRVAIIGLGLMGGSIGLAAKARGYAWEIVGYTRTPARARLALQRGAVDRIVDHPAEAVRDADLAVFCAPVETIIRLVEAARPGLKRGAVVTDVASTREAIDRAVPALLKGTGAYFIGSHPVCGSEQQGIEAARANLYEGALVLVTDPMRVPARAGRQVRGFWQSLGARCLRVDSATHDRILARTSHLPHMIASLLAATVGRPSGPRGVGRFCGRGFIDTTRVAEGSPEVWLDIVRTNRSNLALELRAFGRELERLVDALERGDDKAVYRALERGRAARRRLLARHPLSKESS